MVRAHLSARPTRTRPSREVAAIRLPPVHRAMQQAGRLLLQSTHTVKPFVRRVRVCAICV
eukprot:scaffold3161_cov118-Isochrysis_galbana.AAC.21